MNIGELIRRQAKWTPHKTAIVSGPVRESYGELDRRSSAVVNGLLALGLRHGDRVAALSDNSHHYLEVFGAVAKSGMIMVPLNPRLTAGEIGFMLANSEASVLFVSPDYLSLVESVRASFPELRHLIVLGDAPGYQSYETFVDQSSPTDAHLVVDPNDLVCLSYTGGTTALPKGAMMTHRNLLVNAANVALHWEFRPQSVCLIMLPQSTGGCTHHIVVPHLYVGATFVVVDVRHFEPGRFLDTIQRERVTDVQLVPTHIYRLLDYPHLEDHDLSSLQTIGYGSAPMSAQRLREAIERLGPRFVQCYGQTECGSLATVLRREDHVDAMDRGDLALLASCGHVAPHVDVRLVDDAGNDVPAGEIGEIVIKSDAVMQGYWKAPEATAAALRDGWLFTGDMGRADERGCLTIVDRKKDMIISGGLNISAREIEEVIYRHPAVLECAVVAVPDEQWGEAVKAVVVLRQGQAASEAEIVSLCRQYLGSYKKPSSVDFVAELPKSQMGKILKRELKQQYWKGMERLVH